MAQLNFNAHQVEPDAPPKPLDPGWYPVMVDGSEMKPTRDQTGAYLELRMKVQEGPNAGKTVFDRLNLQNKNPVAQEIAYGRLSAYCHATGVMQVQDSQQLHGIPFQVRVALRSDPSGQYDPSNEVKEVKPLQGAAPAAQAAPAQPAQPTAPAQPSSGGPAAQAPSDVPPWAGGNQG